MVFLTKSVNGWLKKVYRKLILYSMGMQSKDRNEWKIRHFPEVTLRLSFLQTVVKKGMILDSRCLWMINVSVGLAAWQPQGFFFMVLIFFRFSFFARLLILIPSSYSDSPIIYKGCFTNEWGDIWNIRNF